MLTRLLDKGAGELRDNSALRQKAIFPMVHTRPSGIASKCIPAALMPRRQHPAAFTFYLCLHPFIEHGYVACASEHNSRVMGTPLQSAFCALRRR